MAPRRAPIAARGRPVRRAATNARARIQAVSRRSRAGPKTRGARAARARSMEETKDSDESGEDDDSASSPDNASDASVATEDDENSASADNDDAADEAAAADDDDDEDKPDSAEQPGVAASAGETTTTPANTASEGTNAGGTAGAAKPERSRWTPEMVSQLTKMVAENRQEGRRENVVVGAFQKWLQVNGLPPRTKDSILARMRRAAGRGTNVNWTRVQRCEIKMMRGNNKSWRDVAAWMQQHYPDIAGRINADACRLAIRDMTARETTESKPWSLAEDCLLMPAVTGTAAEMKTRYNEFLAAMQDGAMTPYRRSFRAFESRVTALRRGEVDAQRQPAVWTEWSAALETTIRREIDPTRVRASAREFAMRHGLKDTTVRSAWYRLRGNLQDDQQFEEEEDEDDDSSSSHDVDTDAEERAAEERHVERSLPAELRAEIVASNEVTSIVEDEAGGRSLHASLSVSPSLQVSSATASSSSWIVPGVQGPTTTLEPRDLPYLFCVRVGPLRGEFRTGPQGLQWLAYVRLRMGNARFRRRLMRRLIGMMQRSVRRTTIVQREMTVMVQSSGILMTQAHADEAHDGSVEQIIEQTTAITLGTGVMSTPDLAPNQSQSLVADARDETEGPEMMTEAEDSVAEAQDPSSSQSDEGTIDLVHEEESSSSDVELIEVRQPEPLRVEVEQDDVSTGGVDTQPKQPAIRILAPIVTNTAATRLFNEPRTPKKFDDVRAWLDDPIIREERRQYVSAHEQLKRERLHIPGSRGQSRLSWMDLEWASNLDAWIEQECQFKESSPWMEFIREVRDEQQFAQQATWDKRYRDVHADRGLITMSSVTAKQVQMVYAMMVGRSAMVFGLMVALSRGEPTATLGECRDRKGCCVMYDATHRRFEGRVECRHFEFLTSGRVYLDDVLGQYDYRLTLALCTAMEVREMIRREWKEVRTATINEQRSVRRFPIASFDLLSRVTGNWDKLPITMRATMANAVCITLHADQAGMLINQLADHGDMQIGLVTFVRKPARRVELYPALLRSTSAGWMLITHANLRMMVKRQPSHVWWTSMTNVMQQTRRFSAADGERQIPVLNAIAEHDVTSQPWGDAAIRRAMTHAWMKGYRRQLNPEQVEVLEAVLKGDGVHLVQGPFGCGKSALIAAVVAVHKAVYPAMKILVATETNNAMEEDLRRVLMENRVRMNEVLCVGGRWKKAPESMQPAYADFHEEQLRRKYAEEVRNSRMSKGKLNSIVAKDYRDRVRAASVIFSTMTTMGRANLSNFQSHLVIVDEGGQVTEMSLLLSLHETRTLVVIGDPRQLQPYTAVDERIKERYLGDRRRHRVFWSLLRSFERRDGTFPGYTLTTQYRCDARITAFLAVFYPFQLVTGRASGPDVLRDLQAISGKQGSELANHRTAWINCIGSYADENGVVVDEDYDRRNHVEAYAVEDLVVNIANEVSTRIPGTWTMAVITPYRCQLRLLTQLLDARRDEWRSHVTMDLVTTDSCQGLEYDVVITSMVRRNSEGRLGFLAEHPERTLVTLSRAKEYLFILAHLKTFAPQNDAWLALHERAQTTGVLQLTDQRDYKGRQRPAITAGPARAPE